MVLGTHIAIYIYTYIYLHSYLHSYIHRHSGFMQQYTYLGNSSLVQYVTLWPTADSSPSFLSPSGRSDRTGPPRRPAASRATGRLRRTPAASVKSATISKESRPSRRKAASAVTRWVFGAFFARQGSWPRFGGRRRGSREGAVCVVSGSWVGCHGRARRLRCWIGVYH